MMQTTSKTVDFFLGATTPAGFKGYFEPLRREPGMQMYLIKSGPGCGKSTLMKQLAQKAEQQGQSIERVHCASDPDSLDGVVFLGQRAANELLEQAVTLMAQAKSCHDELETYYRAAVDFEAVNAEVQKCAEMLQL